jgi:hypothetical protein
MENEDSTVELHMQEPEAVPTNPVTVKMLTLPSKRCPMEDWYNGFKDSMTR